MYSEKEEVFFVREVNPAQLAEDEPSRGASHHPVCPRCGKNHNVMRAHYRDYRGSAAGAAAFVPQSKFWLCDDMSHGRYGWAT